MDTWAIILSAAGLVTTVLGYITWFEVRRDKRIEKNRKVQEEKDEKIMREVEANVKNEIDIALTGFETTMEDKFTDYVTKQDFAHLQFSFERSERSRLASEIINYAEDLKNGVSKTSASFKHITKAYDIYHGLGANSYIDIEFDFIKSEMAKQKNKAE